MGASSLHEGWRLLNETTAWPQLFATESLPLISAAGCHASGSGNLAQNGPILQEFVCLASEVGCTPAQLALGWLLNRAPHIVPIPGTGSVAHLEENMGAIAIQLDGDLLQLDRLFEVGRIAGERYPPAVQKEIDTEEFAKT